MAITDVADLPLRDIISLRARAAIVTGGAQGLGKGIVRRLAEAGANVVIGDLNQDLAEAAAKELAERFGTRVVATYLDVTDSESVAATAQLAVDAFGGVDIWVNNAGIYPNVTLLDTTDALWNNVMDVNLRGVFAGCRAAARCMMASGRGGVIINIVSTAGFHGVAPGIAAYVASKHGVRGLNRQLAIELAPHDIRVLGVAPTFCTTEGATAAFTASSIQSDRDIVAETTNGSRLGRVGVPDDIGRVVLFCASDMSLFMTGSTLLVDAGEVS